MATDRDDFRNDIRDDLRDEATRRAGDYVRARGARTNGFTGQALKEGYYSGWLDHARVSKVAARDERDRQAIDEVVHAHVLLDRLGAPRDRDGRVLHLADRIAPLLDTIARGVVVSADREHVTLCCTIAEIVAGPRRAIG